MKSIQTTSLVRRNITVCMFLLAFLMVHPFSLYSQANTYPTEQRLFHIERSKNRNLVCYDVNLKDGKLDVKKPLDVYWINREEEPGKRKGLSFVQEKFAYGYKVESKGENTCGIILKSYPGKVLTLENRDGEYVCTLSIDNKLAILKHLYVKAKENDSLSVEYVELFGVTVNGRQSVSEKVYNK